MPTPAVARRVTFDILQRTAQGAYASELLIERTARLDSRDAGLAAEITLGVLRRQGQLDFLIEHFSGRPISRLDPEVAIALRMAIYQIRFLDRVPAYAAVNDSINLIRAARKISSVGFANAVLRKVTSVPLEIPPERAVPGWMLARWTSAFGEPCAAAIARASLETPRLYQHVPVGQTPPSAATATDVPGCWEVTTPDPRYRVQDIGSQAIVPLLGLEAGQTFLDVCAAPGNKTAQALEQTRRAIACDLSFHRLAPLANFGIPLVVCDATTSLPFSRRFDRILVDAPCSGTGTLAHNPEIKWRLQPHDIAPFAARQKQILENALDRLAPDGTLVYSTCSLEPEENEQVARAVAGGRIISELRRMPGREPGDGFYAAVIR